MKRYILILSSILMAVSSCMEDPSEGISNKSKTAEQLTIGSVTVEESTRVLSSLNGTGFYLSGTLSNVNPAEISGLYYDNIKMNYQSGGHFTASTGNLYYPLDGKGVNIYGSWPEKVKFNAVDSIPYMECTFTNDEDYDPVLAIRQKCTSGNVDLYFRHISACLAFRLSVDGGECDGYRYSKIYVKMPTKGIYDIENESWTITETNMVSIYDDEGIDFDGYEYIFTRCTIPSQVTIYVEWMSEHHKKQMSTYTVTLKENYITEVNLFLPAPIVPMG